MKNKRTISLSNGWTAEFENQGEFRMSSEGWNMLLLGPNDRIIRWFQKEIVLVNDYDGSQANSCIQLSENGHHGYLSTGLEAHWVLDFQRCMIAPHRLYISHHQGSKYISAYEQPAFQRTQEYVTIQGELIYITFPFCTDGDFPKVWCKYLNIRRRQLNETYFTP